MSRHLDHPDLEALSAYLDSYREDSSRYWSGINAVALSSRAAEESTLLPDISKPENECRHLAGEVLFGPVVLIHEMFAVLAERIRCVVHVSSQMKASEITPRLVRRRRAF